VNNKQVIIIGGGAAGFFAAINLALKHPNYAISIFEKTDKLLSKVKVSGGGRCNVTHHCFDTNELVKNYPRGNKELRQVFARFNVEDTIAWFGKQGVILKSEEDGRMFPTSDSSQTIIDCFLQLVKKLNIEIKTRCEVYAIHKHANFSVKTSQGVFSADSIVCALGGHPKAGAYDVIKNLGHVIDSPIPSLFTLNFPNETIKKELQGISVPLANVTIAEANINYSGPVLITHWGLSGPAVLKLSAFAAQDFFNLNYHSTIYVNWAFPLKLNQVEEALFKHQKEKHKSLPYSNTAFNLPKRLWEFLCGQAAIDNLKPWAEINHKTIRLLANNLCRSVYKMEGKTTFKEEFVTCGGIRLKDIDFKTMQSKLIPGLFFCGEVLNIDGITGGFNFQSAWSTAWVCAESC
jgi:predicted Rossmann fold flavoprotein